MPTSSQALRLIREPEEPGILNKTIQAPNSVGSRKPLVVPAVIVCDVELSRQQKAGDFSEQSDNPNETMDFRTFKLLSPSQASLLPHACPACGLNRLGHLRCLGRTLIPPTSTTGAFKPTSIRSLQTIMQQSQRRPHDWTAQNNPEAIVIHGFPICPGVAHVDPKAETVSWEERDVLPGIRPSAASIGPDQGLQEEINEQLLFNSRTQQQLPRPVEIGGSVSRVDVGRVIQTPSGRNNRAFLSPSGRNNRAFLQPPGLRNENGWVTSTRPESTYEFMFFGPGVSPTDVPFVEDSGKPGEDKGVDGPEPTTAEGTPCIDDEDETKSNTRRDTTPSPAYYRTSDDLATPNMIRVDVGGSKTAFPEINFNRGRMIPPKDAHSDNATITMVSTVNSFPRVTVQPSSKFYWTPRKSWPSETLRSLSKTSRFHLSTLQKRNAIIHSLNARNVSTEDTSSKQSGDDLLGWDIYAKPEENGGALSLETIPEHGTQRVELQSKPAGRKANTRPKGREAKPAKPAPPRQPVLRPPVRPCMFDLSLQHGTALNLDGAISVSGQSMKRLISHQKAWTGWLDRTSRWMMQGAPDITLAENRRVWSDDPDQEGRWTTEDLEPHQGLSFTSVYTDPPTTARTQGSFTDDEFSTTIINPNPRTQVPLNPRPTSSTDDDVAKNVVNPNPRALRHLLPRSASSNMATMGSSRNLAEESFGTIIDHVEASQQRYEYDTSHDDPEASSSEQLPSIYHPPSSRTQKPPSETVTENVTGNDTSSGKPKLIRQQELTDPLSWSQEAVRPSSRRGKGRRCPGQTRMSAISGWSSTFPDYVYEDFSRVDLQEGGDIPAVDENALYCAGAENMYSGVGDVLRKGYHQHPTGARERLVKENQTAKDRTTHHLFDKFRGFERFSRDERGYGGEASTETEKERAAKARRRLVEKMNGSPSSRVNMSRSFGPSTKAGCRGSTGNSIKPAEQQVGGAGRKGGSKPAQSGNSFSGVSMARRTRGAKHKRSSVVLAQDLAGHLNHLDKDNSNAGDRKNEGWPINFPRMSAIPPPAIPSLLSKMANRSSPIQRKKDEIDTFLAQEKIVHTFDFNTVDDNGDDSEDDDFIPHSDIRYGVFHLRKYRVLPMRKSMPPSQPHKLCFTCPFPGCTHGEVKAGLETDGGVKVKAIQFDPIYMQGVVPENALKSRWIIELRPESNRDNLLLHGFRMRRTHINVRRLDDVYKEEVRVYELYKDIYLHEARKMNLKRPFSSSRTSNRVK